MPKARTRKKACSKCGVGIRADTAFCYNCGNRLPVKRTATREESTGENGAVGTNDAETQAALDDLASRFKLDDITAHPKDTKTSPHTGAATDIEIPAEQSEIEEADSGDKLAKAAA